MNSKINRTQINQDINHFMLMAVAQLPSILDLYNRVNLIQELLQFLRTLLDLLSEFNDIEFLVYLDVFCVVSLLQQNQDLIHGH